MHTPPALLRFIARAALNIAGGGVLGDFALDVLPDVAKDVWKWWNTDRSEDQLRAELQAVAQLSLAETKGYAELAAQMEGAGHPETVRQVVANYVTLVPNAIRQSQRRRGDSSGLSLFSELSLQRAEDILIFLPSKMPRFRPGDRPPGVGDWELQELLGIGGFGEVWMACNPHLPHTVAALKFCTDAMAAKVLCNEAALLGRVMSEGKHQGIVKLLHTYLNAETPCLEYEYVAGGDLTKVIAQWHHSPSEDTVEKATKLVYRLAEIVAYAHKLNPPIVHRDLKPANILLYRTDRGRYAPRVADFGIGGVVAGQALVAHRGSAKCNLLSTALRGAHTPLYASPQQVHGEPPDPRDDVHALGVIWYQLLTGDMNIVSLPADWQDELRLRAVSEDLLALMTSCLASRAEKRPKDAAELARQISEMEAARFPEIDLSSLMDTPNIHPQPANDHETQFDQTSPSGLALPDTTPNTGHYTLSGQPAAEPVNTAQLKPAASIPSRGESLRQVEVVPGADRALQTVVQTSNDEESRRRDAALRPLWLGQVIGQKAIVQRLSIVLNAWKSLKEPVPHILFDGPPGLGKTTFAIVLANELGSSIQMTSGLALKKPADLLPFLTNVEEGSVLFIDEIHRIPRVIEELLYPAMKDFRIDVVLGDGMNARTINLRLKPFTVIGATTRSGMLSGPMRDRFKMHEQLEYYTVEELAEIVRINARWLQTPISDDAALELAQRSRGTPRLANAHIWWSRQYAASEADGHITLELARAALDMTEVDRHGLDKQDRRYLELLVGVHGGGPAGVESLAASMTLPVNKLSDEIEPYLLREQFIMRTRRGRTATARAYQVLGRTMELASKSQKLTDEENTEAPLPPEEPAKDRPTDLFGNAILTDLFGNEIGAKKGRKKR